ncbi:MAG: transposase, partial [Prolixibacteraceae bacterium]|nr:transposase [Prolixibacteraceae bacterium]
YFLTICCKNRIHHFGEIKNDKMNLNKYGEITDTQIQWLEKQYPYFVLHNYIVMPNHVHILCEISVGDGRDHPLRDHPLRDHPLSQKIKSISELMGAFKTTSSKKIHLAENNLFQWQRSFYDHIVKNKKSYRNIFNYINQNPENWNEDTFNE